MEKAEIDAAIGEVARRHNLLLSPDDPLLIVVTLHEILLTRLLARQNQAMGAALDEISAGAAQQVEAAREVAGVVITGGADYVAGALRGAITALKDELQGAATSLKADTLRAAENAKRAEQGAWYAVLVAVAIGCTLLGAAAALLLGPSSLTTTPWLHTDKMVGTALGQNATTCQ